MNNDKIYVTRPFLPPLEEFDEYLKEIWASGQLTNNGQFHQQLEKELCAWLGVNYISLFANGTLALITALQALDIKGEVVTTPYSFVATAHSLIWNGITPVFADIDSEYVNLDPGKIEAAITDKTMAILPVHVYGHPCDNETLGKIAGKHHLKLIYDAAHAFGVKEHGNSILNYGDLSVLSFHATKVFHTFEGGAVICHTNEMKQRIDDLKNFGFRNEITVVAPGINAKMNEVQAAMGLVQLRYTDRIIAKRKVISHLYYEYLKNVEGIRVLLPKAGVEYNYAYFPVFVDELIYGISRDQLYEALKKCNIHPRRYFYPLISRFLPYRDFDSARAANIPVAEKTASQVICLPVYPDLEPNVVQYICDIIRKEQKRKE